MKKLNCWEVKKCGREAGGRNAKQSVCPASSEQRLHGLNGGYNGGRVCFILSQTHCSNNDQEARSRKAYECSKCEFYKSILSDATIRLKESFDEEFSGKN